MGQPRVRCSPSSSLPPSLPLLLSLVSTFVSPSLEGDCSPESFLQHLTPGSPSPASTLQTTSVSATGLSSLRAARAARAWPSPLFCRSPFRGLPVHLDHVSGTLPGQSFRSENPISRVPTALMASPCSHCLSHKMVPQHPSCCWQVWAQEGMETHGPLVSLVPSYPPLLHTTYSGPSR